MPRLYIVITTLILVLTSCNNDGRKNFSLTINHYTGGEGLTLIYKVDKNGIEVETNCDLENCQQKTVYTRPFTKSESDSIYDFISLIQLDTLKSNYKTKNILDGLTTKITVKKGFFSSHTSTFDNYKTRTTDTLFKYVDNLVLTKKYRFHNWGREE